MDLTEISLTVAPVGGHGTVMSVVGAKALGNPSDALSWSDRLDLAELRSTVRELNETAAGIRSGVTAVRIAEFLRS